jgi:hypothetical protein
MKTHRITMITLVGALLRMPVACAVPDHIGGTCDRTEDCFGGINQQPVGSICKQPTGKCECPLGQVVCCDVPYSAGWCAATCPADCNQPDSGADSGVVLCATDSDCNEVAPSPECGGGKCIEGACKLVIEQGPLASQLYGDCKRRECNESGNVVEVEDTSDFYNDGNECTLDYCKGSDAANSLIPDAVPCPQSGEGYCYSGACVQCVATIPAASCTTPGLYCDGFYCVSFAMCNGGSCGGGCAPCDTAAPCGVGTDCASGSCKGGFCALPSCSDGVKNDGETDVDCGFDPCGPCPDGSGCHKPEDCVSGVCKIGKCQAPGCFDQTRNGDEENIDCGGACNPCP